MSTYVLHTRPSKILRCQTNAPTRSYTVQQYVPEFKESNQDAVSDPASIPESTNNMGSIQST